MLLWITVIPSCLSCSSSSTFNVPLSSPRLVLVTSICSLHPLKMSTWKYLFTSKCCCLGTSWWFWEPEEWLSECFYWLYLLIFFYLMYIYILKLFLLPFSWPNLFCRARDAAPAAPPCGRGAQRRRGCHGILQTLCLLGSLPTLPFGLSHGACTKLAVRKWSFQKLALGCEKVEWTSLAAVWRSVPDLFETSINLQLLKSVF